MNKKDAWLLRIEKASGTLLPSEQDELRKVLESPLLLKALAHMTEQAHEMKEKIVGLNLMNSGDLGQAMVLQGRIQMIFKFLDDLYDLSSRPDDEAKE